MEEGEKNSSYSFNLEKQRQTKKKMSKLISMVLLQEN